MLFLITAGLLSLKNSHAAGSTGEPEVITSEIKHLESIRLSNPTAFSQGITDLEGSIDKMSSYQVCHFKFLKAYQTVFSGNAAKAVQDMEDIIPLCEDLRARIRLNALIANITAIGGEYTKASFHIDKAIQNAEETNDVDSIEIAYSGASLVYNLLDQRELSIKYSELLYELDDSSENLCRLEFSRNFNQSSEDTIPDFSHVESFAKQCRESDNLLWAQYLILDNLTRRLKSDGENTISIQGLGEILEGIRAEISVSPYKNIQATFAAIEAEFAWLQSDLELAEQHGYTTLALNKNQGHTDQEIMALKVLEKVANLRREYSRAYDFLQKRNEAELQMYDESQAKQMAFMTVKHTNLAKSFEIDQLSQRNEVLELEKKLARQETNNQRLVILLILTLLGFMSLWLVRIKKKHDYFKDVSEIDHLTKVLTRKAFEEQVSVKLNDCQNKKKPIQVAIMDLDHFKKVNDNHGHLIGDWVLKNVIYSIKELVEENMILARLGGEEFGIVMADVDCVTMKNKLEMMRLAIEGLDCTESGAELQVTASFGYTSSEASGYSLPLLLTHADVALFDAKKHGRNQVLKFVTPHGRNLT